MSTPTTPASRAKTAGLIGKIGLGALGLIGLYKALPYLIELTVNLIDLTGLIATLIISGLAVGALLYIILDPKVQAAVGSFYDALIRKMVDAIIESDPIAILRGYVSDLNQRAEQVDKNILIVSGEAGSMAKAIEENNQAIEANLRKARAAEQIPEHRDEAVVYAREAARLRDSNATMQKVFDRIQLIMRVLTKISKDAKLLIRDMTGEINVKEKEYKVLKSASKAMKGATDIISGSGGKKENFDTAVQFLQDDMGRKIGEIDRYLALTQDFMQGRDLDARVLEQKGLEMLRDFESGKVSLLSPSVPVPQGVTVPGAANQPPPSTTGGRYLNHI